MVVILFGTETANYIQFRLLPKIRITSKKASNESCSKLNFEQKSPRAHMSISPRSRARAPQKIDMVVISYST